jgi:hypothetical protein
MLVNTTSDISKNIEYFTRSLLLKFEKYSGWVGGKNKIWFAARCPWQKLEPFQFINSNK